MTRVLIVGTTAVMVGCASTGQRGGVPSDARCAWQVCVYRTAAGRSVLYQARNAGPVPATVSLEFGDRPLRNLRLLNHPPILAVVPAESQIILARLTRIDPGAPTDAHAVVHIDLGSDASEPDTSVLYGIPFGGSEPRTLVAGYGSPTHLAENVFAVDFEMPEGTPVLAARAGVVVEVQDGFTEGGLRPELIARTNLVAVAHADGTIASYGHLRAGIPVAVGDPVSDGALPGYSGATGFTGMAHLHFHVGKRLMGGEHRTLPVRFAGADGRPVSLREGRRYAPRSEGGLPGGRDLSVPRT